MNDEERSNRGEGWTGIQGDGYPAIADFIARDTDHEAYVFRIFNRLSARNLLHLQGELIVLESKMSDMESEAAKGDDFDVHLAMRSWQALEDVGGPGDKGHVRKKLMRKIEVKVKKYHEALLLQQSIVRLERPRKGVLTALRREVNGMDHDAPKLDGHETCMLDDESDLAALKPPSDRDYLSRMALDHWPACWTSPKKHSTIGHASVQYFEERRLIRFVSALSTATASALLIAPILILYFVTSPNARLALVITFIAVFALGLSVTTSATRDSIFGATAAYSAVLVVFVSGNLGNVSTNTPSAGPT